MITKTQIKYRDITSTNILQSVLYSTTVGAGIVLGLALSSYLTHLSFSQSLYSNIQYRSSAQLGIVIAGALFALGSITLHAVHTKRKLIKQK